MVVLLEGCIQGHSMRPAVLLALLYLRNRAARFRICGWRKEKPAEAGFDDLVDVHVALAALATTGVVMVSWMSMV